MKKSYGILLAALGAATVSQVQADTLADFTFETSAPTTAGPFAPEGGNETSTATITGSHAGAAVYSSPSGNGSTHSFSSTLWAVGDNYTVHLNTVGYEDVTLTFDQTSSNTGPGKYQLQWSTDDITFNNVGSVYTVLANAAPNTAWTPGTVNPAFSFSIDLSSVTQINDQSSVFIRFEDANTTSANGGTVAVGGTDRIDNIDISATVVPEPTTLSLLGMGGLTAFGFLFRRKK